MRLTNLQAHSAAGELFYRRRPGWGEGSDSDLGDVITSCYMRFLVPRN